MPRLRLRVSNAEAAETIENALEAAASARGKTLNTSRGRPGPGEISRQEAMRDLAAAFTGYDATGEYPPGGDE